MSIYSALIDTYTYTWCVLCIEVAQIEAKPAYAVAVLGCLSDVNVGVYMCAVRACSAWLLLEGGYRQKKES